MSGRISRQELGQTLNTELDTMKTDINSAKTAVGTSFSDTGNLYVASNVETALAEVRGETNTAKTAVGTAITDSGGFYTGINVESALSEIGNALSDMKVTKSGKDAEGVFVTVEYRRKADNTLFARSVLSGGTTPKYTTRTITYYEANGSTVKKTVSLSLSYDSEGDLVSEV